MSEKTLNTLPNLQLGTIYKTVCGACVEVTRIRSNMDGDTWYFQAKLLEQINPVISHIVGNYKGQRKDDIITYRKDGTYDGIVRTQKDWPLHIIVEPKCDGCANVIPQGCRKTNNKMKCAGNWFVKGK